jgi:peptide/nickel transport system substrate-binding protein
VLFASDPANPDTAGRFSADLQMFARQAGIDPLRSMQRYTSWEIASKANNWFRANTTRWRSDEYDRLWTAARTELDPVKRAALFIRMNDLVVREVVVIPIFRWNYPSAVSLTLGGVEMTPWDSIYWNLAFWHRRA